MREGDAADSKLPWGINAENEGRNGSRFYLFSDRETTECQRACLFDWLHRLFMILLPLLFIVYLLNRRYVIVKNRFTILILE